VELNIANLTCSLLQAQRLVASQRMNAVLNSKLTTALGRVSQLVEEAKDHELDMKKVRGCVVYACVCAQMHVCNCVHVWPWSSRHLTEGFIQCQCALWCALHHCPCAHPWLLTLLLPRAPTPVLQKQEHIQRLERVVLMQVGVGGSLVAVYSLAWS